jgi:glutamine amidotransferase
MCRLFAALVSTPRHHRRALVDAPRSLAGLSDEHPHGWGVAVWRDDEGWRIDKRPVRARDCDRYRACAAQEGEVVIAHVRQGTVGPQALHNTHPFRRGRWVFAHNGTIEDLDWLRAQTCPDRQRDCEGQTDSELFFSYLLSALDAAGVVDAPADARTDAALVGALDGALARARFGAVNFLLSDGRTLYAHRWGRTMLVADGDGGGLVASEVPEGEDWRVVPEGTLLRVERGLRPSWREVCARPRA